MGASYIGVHHVGVSVDALLYLYLMGGVMKILVAIEFEGVEPNSEQADQIIEMVGDACETIGVGFDASSCYIDDCVATGTFVPNK